MAKLFSIFLMFFVINTSLSAQVNTESKESVLVVYKNSSRDILVVKSVQNGVKIKSVAIFDILGTQIVQFSSNSNSVEIDMSRFRAGKYLMSYTLSDNVQKVKQIIKQ